MSLIFRALVSMSKVVINVHRESVLMAVFDHGRQSGSIKGINVVIGFKELRKGALCFFSSSKGRYFKSVYLSKMDIKSRVQ